MTNPTPFQLISLPSLPGVLSARSLRSNLLRLPLFTRITVLMIILFYLLSILLHSPSFDFVSYLSLQPSKTGLTSGGMYRLNTFPFVHIGFFHTSFNLLALTPLLERFEREWGTLNCFALYLGPLATIPGGLYLLLDGVVFRADTPVCGGSIWVFLLLAAESCKIYKVNPFFDVAGTKIPTWTTPIVIMVVTSILIPNTSFLGHACGLAVGFLWGLGYIRFLAPPERALRWIEGKLNLLGRLPHYVSVDQKTFGRYGVLPTTEGPSGHQPPIGMGWVGTSGNGQRLGP